MKFDFLFVLLFLFVISFPVAATDVLEGDIIDQTVAADPDASTSVSPDPAQVDQSEAAAGETGLDDLSIDGSLAGGYYFICDCVLGYDLKFYVPFDWANDVFTFDSSGAPVNLSNSTCYAWCPTFPDYTFSCNRFSTFTYRGDNYNTVDLEIRNISETNIVFLEDESPRLSDSDILVFIAGLVFVLGVSCIVLRRR